MPATPRLFEWLNEQNIRNRDVKVIRFERGSVQAHVYLRTDDIIQASLTTAVNMVGQFADQVDDQLVASLGGKITNPS